MSRSALLWSATAVLAVGTITPAMARPQYLMTFKAHYNTASGKPTLNAAMCNLCHIGMPREANWNPWGQAVRTALAGAKNVTERPKIVAAFEAAEKGQNTAAGRTYAQLIAADVPPASTQRPAGAGAGSAPVRGVWEPVFNGVNMTGLHKMNAGNWTVENFLLKYTGGGNGWLRSDKQYTNYSLVFVWRYPQPSPANDSGLFLKASMDGNPWPDGANWQLNMGPGQNFGSLGGTQGSRARADLIRPNDWNTYQVTVQNGTVTCAINGQPAWEQATGIPNRPGYIGIQAENRPLEIAQLWVMPLP